MMAPSKKFLSPACKESWPFVLAGPGWTVASLHTVTDLVHRALEAFFNGRFSTPPESGRRIPQHAGTPDST